MNRSILHAWLAIALAALAPLARAERGAEREVETEEPEAAALGRAARKLLAARCFTCHGPDAAARKAELRLDRDEGWRRAEGASRALLAPGAAAQSALLARVQSDDPEERMPPPEAGEALSTSEIALLARWIDAGAELPAHWAFEPLQEAEAPPLARDEEKASSIDAFVAARLAAEGLELAAEADRATLLRRASLDLLGLPPAPEEIAAFESDPSADAWERVIERLLHSPHYSERRARHWLDLARYADSNGYANDQPRSIWPYRDWVIRAFEEDLPFDRFTVAQLAGDLLPNATREDRVATGFARNSPHQEEGGSDEEQYRVEAQTNRTEALASTWLGLSLGCARCHDHKYDPLTQRDYFSLYAFFEQADDAELELPSAEQAARTAELERAHELARIELAAHAPRTRDEWRVLRVASARAEGAELRVLEDDSLLAQGANPANDRYVVELELPAGSWRALRLEALTHPSLPKQGPGRAPNGNFVLAQVTAALEGGAPLAFAEARADHEQKGYPARDALSADLRDGWAIGGVPAANVERELQLVLEESLVLAAPRTLRLELAFREDDGAPRYNLGRWRLSATEAAPASLALGDEEGRSKRKAREAAANALAQHRASLPRTLVLLQRAEPRATFVHRRGDFLSPGEAVSASTPACLPPLTRDASAAEPTRLDLARWLVSGANPLVARVAVNRLWAELFGQGLVPTHEDFGTQGELPAHPELLDHLARRYQELGWSTRALLREILSSRTYRQSSRVIPALAERDPRNLLLARQSRWRVEAEIVRDLALAASGALVPEIGGPSVYPPMPPELMRLSSSGNKWPESVGGARYRRGLYTATFRANEYALSALFDAPDRVNSCTRRTRSNTPLQALALANDPAFLELARLFGERLRRERSGDAERLRSGFLLALGRAPTERERGAAERYLAVLRARFEADREAAEAFAGAGADAAERALWTGFARWIMNLDGFVTRS
ncbi:MAG: PSD1 domain-containing protein [Planctomycetes bacterium]|nr:PSD1 domain-containing protein [Planctomycetota bacterium]